MKEKVCGFVVGLMALGILLSPFSAQAQGFDPRPTLLTLISAFQNCGPPQAYQVLSPYLFSLVAQQTGGAGCYVAIAQAGPVTGAQVIDTKIFPAGPLSVVRVTHVTGPVDWFIGFELATGKVNYLTFQSVVEGTSPSIATGADRSANLGLIKPPKPNLDKDVAAGDSGDEGGKKPKPSPGCKKFPVMCQ